ncbi:MAG: YicC/YloC family endoribonuclease [Spirochaetota bacterium]|nr:YicC/YloC family endoribonuclease [Spirochaetota bacterium]
MESMTGYAYIESSTDQFSFSVEIKSVNSKYCDIYTNLPDILRVNEEKMTSLLREYFVRGKIELTINLFDWKRDKNVKINDILITKYYNELSRIVEELKLDHQVTLDQLLKMDNLIQKERGVVSTKSMKEIFSAVNRAIKQVMQMKIREGNATKKDLHSSLSIITAKVKEIKDFSKDISKGVYHKLRKRIDSFHDINVDDARLYAEVAILADRMDINEEIVRLIDHLKKFKSILNEKSQIGKRLDFLAQEMFREINTISSKSNCSKVSHIVVDVKNHIDKIREHCRNVV